MVAFFCLLLALACLIVMVIARHAQKLWLAFFLLGATSIFYLALPIFLGTPAIECQVPWFSLRQGPVLFLDRLSTFFLLLVWGVGGAVCLYSLDYWGDAQHPESASTSRGWIPVFLGSMTMLLLQRHALHFLLWWELFALSAYFLITLDKKDAGAWQAGWLYLGASHAGTLLLILFFSMLHWHTDSWLLGPLHNLKGMGILFWPMLVGFGIKSGIFFLHVWLPSAHASAPSHISALMSGLGIKMGIYGLLRFSFWLPLPPSAGWTITALGALSALLGVIFALAQHDIKRLLAYCSVENIGVILLGLGTTLLAHQYGHPQWGALALCGTLLHIANHASFKALLFLSAGSLVQSTKTRTMSHMGGLFKTMPWTASFFTLGAMAICALPPTNGFISEWLIFRGLFGATSNGQTESMIALCVLAATGALALACFVKACGIMLLGSPRSPAAENAQECSLSMRLAMGFLSLCCIAIGIAPILSWQPLTAIATSILPGTDVPDAQPVFALTKVHLLLSSGFLILSLLTSRLFIKARKSPTWDCGYHAPSPRMQYTASSFTNTISTWFSWIIYPVHKILPVHGFFPKQAKRTEYITDTTLELCIFPVARGILFLSEKLKILQQGRIQLYILYVCLGLALAGGIAWQAYSGTA